MGDRVAAIVCLREIAVMLIVSLPLALASATGFFAG
jgi:hypothetical protein